MIPREVERPQTSVLKGGLGDLFLEPKTCPQATFKTEVCGLSTSLGLCQRWNPTSDRTCLLAMLIIAAGGVPIFENPGSSLLSEHPRFKLMVSILHAGGIRNWKEIVLTRGPDPGDVAGCCCFPLSCASGIYRQGLWMKLYGHLCLKRTLIWSSSPAIRLLDLGPIRKGVHKSLVSTAVKYKSKEGAWRYKGTRALKSTQRLETAAAFEWLQQILKSFLGVKSGVLRGHSEALSPSLCREGP